MTTLEEYRPHRPDSTGRRWRRRQGWSIGVWILLVVLIAWYTLLIPRFGSFQIASIAKNSLPLSLPGGRSGRDRLAGGIDSRHGGDAGVDQFGRRPG